MLSLLIAAAADAKIYFGKNENAAAYTVVVHARMATVDILICGACV